MRKRGGVKKPADKKVCAGFGEVVYKFKCGACKKEFKKCSSCDINPETHRIVNHVPGHGGECKGRGHIIKKFKCKGCKVEYDKCASCGLGPDKHKKVNHPPTHK